MGTGDHIIVMVSQLVVVVVIGSYECAELYTWEFV